MNANNNNDSNDFLLTSSFEEEIRKFVQYKKVCPTCKSPSKKFFCSYCVTDGEFTRTGSSDTNSDSHSNINNKERFIEKKLKKDHLLRVKIKLLARIEDEQKQQVQCQLLRDKLVEAEYRVKALKSLHEERQWQCEKNKLTHDELIKHRHIYEQRCQKYVVKIEKAHTYRTTYDNYIRKKRALLTKNIENIISLKRSHLQNLITHIFPLEVKEHVVADDDNDAVSRVSELAEASRLVYVDGEWVSGPPSDQPPHPDHLTPSPHSNTSDYWIVTPNSSQQTAHANYNTYFTPPLPTPSAATTTAGDATRSDHQQQQQVVSSSPGFHRVAACLSYSTQLVNVLAYILDVNVPKHLCYSIFSSFTLDCPLLNKAVKSLHRNVIYLCLSQGVDPELLRSKLMLHNLYQLIHSPHIASCTSYELDDSLVHSLEDSYHIIGSDGSYDWVESDSDGDVGPPAPGAGGGGSDDEMQGWESVPHLLPSISPMMQGTATSPPPGSEGFLGAAALSMASWFRTATGASQSPAGGGRLQ